MSVNQKRLKTNGFLKQEIYQIQLTEKQNSQLAVAVTVTKNIHILVEKCTGLRRL
jgi:hypothetical protein